MRGPTIRVSFRRPHYQSVLYGKPHYQSVLYGRPHYQSVLYERLNYQSVLYERLHYQSVISTIRVSFMGGSTIRVSFMRGSTIRVSFPLSECPLWEAPLSERHCILALGVLRVWSSGNSCILFNSDSIGPSKYHNITTHCTDWPSYHSWHQQVWSSASHPLVWLYYMVCV